MNKIDSFTVDHIRLKKGVYVSRIDHIGSEILTTFDIRMKKPNRKTLENGAIHTLEHLIATYVRNDETFSQKVVYFGPMGCLTGMYLIVHGAYTSKEILPLLIRAFEFVVGFEGAIPGVSEIECGTYKLHDLEGAKAEAKAYLDVLKNADDSCLNYPE
ncbi:S-ribosylhomocysteine lyase [Fusibacter sp. JL298sf-3]